MSSTSLPDTERRARVQNARLRVSRPGRYFSHLRGNIDGSFMSASRRSTTPEASSSSYLVPTTPETKFHAYSTLVMFWSPYSDPFYGYGSFYDGFGVNRRGFAAVSQRARDARATAENLFLEYLAGADTSKGSVTEEIIQFHMVPDMRKAFSKFVREHGGKASSRQLTRAEQDKINPGRKSLMWYTSVTISAAAQKAYTEKNPVKAEELKKKYRADVAARSAKAAKASAAAGTQNQPVASGSGASKSSSLGLSQPVASQSQKVKA